MLALRTRTERFGQNIVIRNNNNNVASIKTTQRLRAARRGTQGNVSIGGRRTLTSESATTTTEMSTVQKILTFNGLGPKYPWTFGVSIATIKTGIADIFVQKQVEKREEIDWKRVGLFTFFGFAYLGIVQYLIYVNLFSHLFKNAAAFGKMPFREKIRNKDGLKDLGKQIVVDMFVHGPLFFFPCYYIAKESIQGSNNVLQQPGDVVKKAMQKYGKNYWDDWIALWQIWIPGDAFVFALPLWARLPANHAISFVYMCILSFTRGAEEEEDGDESKKRALIRRMSSR